MSTMLKKQNQNNDNQVQRFLSSKLSFPLLNELIVEVFNH